MRCGNTVTVVAFSILYLLNIPAHAEKPTVTGSEVAQPTRAFDGSQAQPHSPAPTPSQAAATQASTALPLPRPPADGEVNTDTTRLSVYQENARWTRETTFQRVAGGRWIVASDALKTKPPLQCHANPPECDTLPP